MRPIRTPPAPARPDIPAGRRAAAVPAAVGVLAVLAGHADAQTLGDMAEEATQSLDAVGPLLSAAFYIIGLVTVGWALLRLRQHFNQPDRNLLAGSVAGIIVAVCLFLTPALINNLGETLGLGGAQQLEKPKF